MSMKFYSIPIDKNILDAHIKFVKHNMTGLTPIYPKEMSRLKKYAKDNNINLSILLSIRNQLKIQTEIHRSRFVEQNKDKIIQIFNKLIKENPKNLTIDKIMDFYSGLLYPPAAISKIISSTDSFKALDHSAKKNFFQIIKDINRIEQKSKISSEKFEHTIEEFLSETHIKFQTEADIRKNQIYKVTPDILFDQPVILNIDGKNHPIRWLDAKNFVFLGEYVPSLYKKIVQQAKKYNDVFGPGAFIFRYGFVSGVQIDGTYLLDGTQLA